MSRYLSLDIETTGTADDVHIIEFGVVPVDVATKQARLDLSFQCYLKCPSFEELKPTLNDFVLANNEELINTAHEKGISQEEFLKKFDEYMNSPKIKEFFNNEKPVLMGKSMTALDVPMIIRDFGRDTFMRKYFYHASLDVSGVARAAVDAGKLPQGCTSSKKLAQHFGFGDDVAHTVIEDALDVFKMYLSLIKL